MSVLIGALALVSACVLAVAARAESTTTITGEARGITVSLGDDDYIVVGTYRDSFGFPGTYSGRYHLDTTGFNSCRLTPSGAAYCGLPRFPYRCNLISGQMTFRSLGKRLDLILGAASPGPPGNRVLSGICQQEANPSLYDTYLLSWNRSNVWPATTEEFSRGYGLLNIVEGSMTGVSAPVGQSSNYFDDLSLRLTLDAP